VNEQEPESYGDDRLSGEQDVNHLEEVEDTEYETDELGTEPSPVPIEDPSVAC
jgi:hypothetical protein